MKETAPTRERSIASNYADVVVGGQAGSEGKGAVAAWLVRHGDYAAAVRPGASNAGHTVHLEDPGGDSDGYPQEYIHQVLPVAASVSSDVRCYMAPESAFGLDEFFEEIQDMADRWSLSNARARVRVDPEAAVITDHHRHLERSRKLGRDIGSTVHGCGAVRVEKIWRSAGDVRLARQYAALEGLVLGRVPDMLADHGDDGDRVLVEGTQGTLLSLNQSGHWPYCTSRDCIASSFLSACGLPPDAAGDVWAVFRTYPIRVGGDSGPMDGREIDFETIGERAGMSEPPVEYTSVTRKKRRVFEWSYREFDAALRLNSPDAIALTFLDYLDADNRGVDSWGGLTESARDWVRFVDRRARAVCGAEVRLLKTGPAPGDAVDLRGLTPVTKWHSVPEASDGRV